MTHKRLYKLIYEGNQVLMRYTSVWQ